MKKIIIILAAVFISAVVSAQNVTFTQEDLQKLDPALKAQIERISAEKEITGKIETFGKWAGMGKEIGVAVNESLIALTKTATDFSETKLGHFTMFLVAYKVIGIDMLQLIFGIIWICLILGISFFVNRQLGTDRRVLVSKKWKPEARSFELQYEIIRGHNDFKVTAVCILIIGLMVSVAIIFV